MDTEHKKNQSGQALVELCIGLIAILTVFAGIIQIGRMGLARMEARVEATGTASALSMNAASTSFRLIRSYIRQMDEGGDQRSYSLDDVAMPGNRDEMFDTLLAPNQPGMLNSYAPGNILAGIQNPVDMMGETGLVRSTASENNIPVLPIVRKLFIQRNTVDIDVTVWSIRTGDLY